MCFVFKIHVHPFFFLFLYHFDLYQSLYRLLIWNSQNCSMFPLAFVAGSFQGHWWGFISRNYVVWPIFSLMNVFIALKGTQFLNFIWIFCAVSENMVRCVMCMCKGWITCYSWSVLLATDSNSTVLHFDSLKKLDACMNRNVTISTCQVKMGPGWQKGSYNIL